jgi:hypothetical protein
MGLAAAAPSLSNTAPVMFAVLAVSFALVLLVLATMFSRSLRAIVALLVTSTSPFSARSQAPFKLGSGATYVQGSI